jgi:hypothetical protein
MDQINIYDMAAKEFRKITMAGRVVTVEDVRRVYHKALVMGRRWRNPKNAA